MQSFFEALSPLPYTDEEGKGGGNFTIKVSHTWDFKFSSSQM